MTTKQMEAKIEKLQKENDDLKKQSNFMVSQNSKLKDENDELKNTIKSVEKNHDRLYDRFVGVFNPNTLTIQKASKILLESFESISCPITRKEAFKQFVGNVIGGYKQDLEAVEESVSNQTNELNFNKSIYKDIKEFTARTAAEEINLVR